MRKARSSVVCCLVLALLTPPDARADSPRPAIPCDAFAISPHYLHDRTLVCVARKIDLPQFGPTGVVVSVSRDGGTTWLPQAAVGLPISATSYWDDVQFSPDYDKGGVFYVQEASGGLFQSGDGGATFTLADPLARGGGVRAQLAPMWLAVAAPAGPLAGLAYASLPAAFVRPPAHLPVAGTTAQLQALVALNRPDRTSAVFAVSQDLGAPQSYVFTCGEFLACTQQVEKLPAGQLLEAAAPLMLGPNRGAVWVGSRDYVAGDRLTAQNRLLTPEGGVARLPALDRIIAGLSGDAAEIHFWVTNGATPGSLVARISRGALVRSGPTDVLYSSKDLGVHWGLTTTTTNRGVFTRFESLPSPSVGSMYFRAAIFAAPDGRLFVLGPPSRGANALLGAVMCSVDRGRTWHEWCKS